MNLRPSCPKNLRGFVTSIFYPATIAFHSLLRSTPNATLVDLYRRCNAGLYLAPKTMLLNIFQRSEEHTSELQSLMRISYAVFCLKKKTKKQYTIYQTPSK